MLNQATRHLADNPSIIKFIFAAIAIGCVYLLWHEIQQQRQSRHRPISRSSASRRSKPAAQSKRFSQRTDSISPPISINPKPEPTQVDSVSSVPITSEVNTFPSVHPLEDLPPDISIADSIPDYAPTKLPKKLFPHPLHAKLARQVGEDAPDRLMDRYQQKYPDRPEKWLYEKAFYDLERDKR